MLLIHILKFGSPFQPRSARLLSKRASIGENGTFSSCDRELFDL